MSSWDTLKICKVISLFVLSGFAEIGGGWFIWAAVRQNKPKWFIAIGAALLLIYGFIPTLQPLDDFGRLYAVYGGIFIVMSFAWAAVIEGFVPDKGDIIGSVIALIGVAVVLFWPRDNEEGAQMTSPPHAANTSVSNPLFTRILNDDAHL